MNCPTEFFQISLPLSIPDDIGFKLFVPEYLSTFRRICELAVPVSVPETPVYKQDGSQFRKNNVRATGKTSYMDAKAKPQSVQQRSDGQFWLGILGANPRHVPAAPLLRDAIGHKLWYRHMRSVEQVRNDGSYLSCQQRRHGVPDLLVLFCSGSREEIVVREGL